jgi:hypothetical protein
MGPVRSQSQVFDEIARKNVSRSDRAPRLKKRIALMTNSDGSAASEEPAAATKQTRKDEPAATPAREALAVVALGSEASNASSAGIAAEFAGCRLEASLSDGTSKLDKHSSGI